MSEKANRNRRVTTLRDIASLAGVTPTAVSMALANHPRIGTEKKVQIREIARDLGYVVNSAARTLRLKQANAIALVVPNTGHHVFGHPYFMHLLVGVTESANTRGCTVTISTNLDEQHGVVAYERVLQSGAVDGAIIASASILDPYVRRMLDSDMPVVLIGNFPDFSESINVGIDDVLAASLLTRHLTEEHGFRKIGHISGPLSHQSAIDRVEGYRQVINRISEKLPEYVAVGDFSEESGQESARQLLDAHPDLEAIFAANDEMAFGALLEFRSRGLRVPEDIALVGFDDFGVARLTTPGMTTIRVPAEELGRVATEKLFELISGVKPDQFHTTLPVELVIRESCGSHQK